MSRAVFITGILMLVHVLTVQGTLSRSFMKLEEFFNMHKVRRITQALPSPVFYNSVEEKYIVQVLDHFDPERHEAFSQRYFVCEKYWNKQSGPVFFYVGGEGALVPEVLLGGEIVELARKYNALLVALEHRFYGKSVPQEGGLKLHNLQYLSSQQALADAARFHQRITDSYSLAAGTKWIAFGGSYPGALAAWIRTKFPHTVYGAIASSAPVLAQEDFTGYNDVVADSLTDPIVGGSVKCRQVVAEAFSTIDQMIDARQFQRLQTDFLSCNSISNVNDSMMFVNNLAGIFMGVIQYNNEKEGLNIRGICAKMTDKALTPYEKLVDFNKEYLKRMFLTCNDNSYAKYVAQLKNVTKHQSSGAGYRQWIYQTCTQFGYYQTCEPHTGCIFSKLLTLESNLQVCEDVYEISASTVKRRVQFTNDYYGGKSPDGTRIVFVNGSVDPWHKLSVLRNDTVDAEVSIFIHGTAHCANMEGSHSDDPPQLTAARKETSKIIGKWLTLEESS